MSTSSSSAAAAFFACAFAFGLAGGGAIDAAAGFADDLLDNFGLESDDLPLAGAEPDAAFGFGDAFCLPLAAAAGAFGLADDAGFFASLFFSSLPLFEDFGLPLLLDDEDEADMFSSPSSSLSAEPFFSSAAAAAALAAAAAFFFFASMPRVAALKQR